MKQKYEWTFDGKQPRAEDFMPTRREIAAWQEYMRPQWKAQAAALVAQRRAEEAEALQQADEERRNREQTLIAERKANREYQRKHRNRHKKSDNNLTGS